MEGMQKDVHTSASVACERVTFPAMPLAHAMAWIINNPAAMESFRNTRPEEQYAFFCSHIVPPVAAEMFGHTVVSDPLKVMPEAPGHSVGLDSLEKESVGDEAVAVEMYGRADVSDPLKEMLEAPGHAVGLDSLEKESEADEAVAVEIDMSLRPSLEDIPVPVFGLVAVSSDAGCVAEEFCIADDSDDVHDDLYEWYVGCNVAKVSHHTVEQTVYGALDKDLLGIGQPPSYALFADATRAVETPRGAGLDHPVVTSKFTDQAKEIVTDAVTDDDRVMGACLGDNQHEALLKSMYGVGSKFPKVLPKLSLQPVIDICGQVIPSSIASTFQPTWQLDYQGSDPNDLPEMSWKDHVDTDYEQVYPRHAIEHEAEYCGGSVMPALPTWSSMMD